MEKGNPEEGITPGFQAGGDQGRKEPAFERVAVLGLGQMGGSFALAARERGLGRSFSGFSRSPETRAEAVRRGVVDEAPDRVEICVEGASLVYLATPVRSIEPLLRQIRNCLSTEVLLTDTGSTKVEIVRGVETLGLSACFVGGHPMCGTERAGLEAADSHLFEGATYVLTPTASTPPARLAQARQMVTALGSRVLELSPELHDRAAAAISHLPHVLAHALLLLAGQRQAAGEPVFELAAGSFRSGTRVAGSNPQMWSDIFASNRTEVLRALDETLALLYRLRAEIAAEDLTALQATLEEARALQEKVRR